MYRPHDPFGLDPEWEPEAPRPRPPTLQPLPGFTLSETKAIYLTNYIETGQRRLGFGKLAGNFDGCGLSFGVLQWNVRTGSLQPLLQRFAREHPDRLRAVFGSAAEELRRVLAAPPARQLEWARALDQGGRTIREPWRSAFARLGAEPAFQIIELEAMRPRLARAVEQTRRLGLATERALALMFDLVTQQGPAWPSRARRSARIAAAYETRQRAKGAPLDEREKLLAIADVIAETTAPRWREKVRQRKRAIALGRGPFRGGVLEVDRDFGITDAPFQATAAPAARAGTPARAPAAKPPPRGTSAAAGAPMISPLAVARRGLRKGRSRTRPVFGIVVHTTGSGPASRERRSGGKKRAIEYALDYYLGGGEGYAHYVIDYDGTIHAIADERTVAAHAGLAPRAFAPPWTAPAWWSRVWSRTGARTPLDLLPRGVTNANAAYIGIELLGPRAARAGYTDAQYRSLARLVGDIRRRHRLDIRGAPSRTLLGHEDLNPLRSVGGSGGRADANGGWDPGAHRTDPRFSWARLWRELEGATGREVAAA